METKPHTLENSHHTYKPSILKNLKNTDVKDFVKFHLIVLRLIFTRNMLVFIDWEIFAPVISKSKYLISHLEIWNSRIKCIYEQAEDTKLQYFFTYLWLLEIQFKSSKLAKPPIWFLHNTNKEKWLEEKLKDEYYHSKVIPGDWETARLLEARLTTKIEMIPDYASTV